MRRAPDRRKSACPRAGGITGRRGVQPFVPDACKRDGMAKGYFCDLMNATRARMSCGLVLRL
jgi:hypothetical protein